MQLWETLRSLKRGQFAEELDTELRHAVDAVRAQAENGRAVTAEVTVKLKIKPLKGDPHAVTVEDVITSKLPAPAGGQTIYFVGAEGALVREDPRQQPLPLREITKAQG